MANYLVLIKLLLNWFAMSARNWFPLRFALPSLARKKILRNSTVLVDTLCVACSLEFPETNS